MVYRILANDAFALRNVQNRLNIFGYYITKITTGKRYTSAMTNIDFPFIERVNEINHRLYQSGLYRKYLNDLSFKYETYLLQKNCNISGYRKKDSFVESFEFPKFIIYGWCAGVIVFVIEITWKKFEFSLLRQCFTKYMTKYTRKH